MSLTAERALIGGLMVEPGSYGECAAIVTPEEFADPAHGQIWAAMGELVRKHLAPEPEAVLAHLNGAGDQKLIAGLYRDAIGAANAIHYAGLVHTAALRRRLADLGERLLVVRPDDVVEDLVAETRRAVMDLERDQAGSGPPPRAALIPSGEEILLATLAPRCIVERYLFADVATLIAPGGTGKTTLLLFESVQIALGRTLHGLQVIYPGWTLIVTAEDARPRLLARLSEIVRALGLDEQAAALVFESVIVWDVAGRDLRLARMRDGNVVLTALADDIAARYREDPPAVIVFDPLASFGASEQAVNDNEQALITASRRLVGALGCCVRLIHHTGKANARQATPDQYAGRGGSALADGSRMTTVLQAYDPEANDREPPPGCLVNAKASITILHRLKLSYAPPHLPRIWVRREGFAFESFIEPPPLSKEQAADAQGEQILRFLTSELNQGRYWTKNQLDTAELGISRQALRAAVTRLEVAGRVVHADLPEEQRQGRRQRYLRPVYSAAPSGGMGSEDGE